MSLVAAVVLAAFAAGCECDGDEDLDGGHGDGEILDGGPDAGPGPDGPRITICPGDALPALPEGVCETTAGDANLLITADVLTPGEVFRGGQVLVDTTGHIACVGCDCSASAAGATRITCPNGVLSPGLINAHEHITFQGAPYVGTAERYEHRHDWREGRRRHREISSGADVNSEQWDELREVMSGVTSVNGSGSPRGLLRNLDVASAQENLGQAAVDYDTFPLGDQDGTQLATGCGYDRRPNAMTVAREDAYTPHVAEGIDAVSRNEFLCMREGANDAIEGNVAIIHGVGLLAPDIAEMAMEQTSLIWSPRSNIALYGDTARVTLYDRLGVLIAMGTDWQRSGSMNMLRELACADELNESYLGRHFSDEDLWLMATRNGAVATATDDVIGTIAQGLVADLAIFDGAARADHRAVIEAQPQDVALVLRGGTVLYGEPAVVGALPGGEQCEAMPVCGVQRAACVMRELDTSLSALMQMNQTGYPLFFCDGATPMNEPSCRPERNANEPLPLPTIDGSNRYDGMITADDGDGDGIANASDLCPTIFDPIRPLDMGAQADFDMDGVGDECDPCPLDASTTECSVVDPNDRDADDVPDTADNCPGVPNADQSDRDEDQIGDPCDACPDAPNRGGAACPATIYEVKTGAYAPGGRVRVSGSVVTGVAATGFTMQVPSDHPQYTDANNSGIFVYTRSAPQLADRTPITRGTTVDVEGQVLEFAGQLQLGFATVTASATTSAIPAPVDATPAELLATGTRGMALEGVLVRVSAVTVSNPNVDPGVFAITGGLNVADFFYRLDPFVAPNESFSAITGVLFRRSGANNLMPRAADDFIAGAPQLAGFTPARAFARLGASGATIPQPLSVQLTRASSTPTMVTITSSEPAALVVTDVVIPAGRASAEVPVTGMTAGEYTLTASVGGPPRMAMVRVIAADEAPTTFTLTPPTAMVRATTAATFTVTLDVPAPPGGARLMVTDTTGGEVPAEVIVPADAIAATFEYTAPEAEGSGALTVSLTGTDVTQTAEITVLPARAGRLVINEVDYDQPMTDTAEFVEIHNPGTRPVALATLQLILVSEGSIYRTIMLGSAGAELPAGGYLVVKSRTVTAAAGALTIDFMGAQDNLQNGTRDGMILWDTASSSAIDVIAYEGEVRATVDGTSVDLVEGTRFTGEDTGAGPLSLTRIPNGSDSDDAATDWRVTMCPSPGAANPSTCP